MTRSGSLNEFPRMSWQGGLCGNFDQKKHLPAQSPIFGILVSGAWDKLVLTQRETVIFACWPWISIFDSDWVTILASRCLTAFPGLAARVAQSSLQDLPSLVHTWLVVEAGMDAMVEALDETANARLLHAASLTVQRSPS